MARETAEVVLMDNDLLALITAIETAQRAMRTVRENVGIVVFPNVAGMAAAALVGISPAIAVVLNNGAAIAAEMNGFRPLLGPESLRHRLFGRRSAAALPAGAASPALLPAPAVPAAPASNGHSADSASLFAATAPLATLNGAANGRNGHGGQETVAPDRREPAAEA
jgi:hypothetical protein